VTLIDSNVLIDVISRGASWIDWSISQINHRAAAGPMYINDIIYAELAVKTESETALDEALRIIGAEFSAIPKTALFLAAKVFGRYRAAGGPRLSNLPGFFIGAHAQVSELPLLTRDPQRYKRYFPSVTLIAP
jgi:predicted nucleic acid-binding protein